ncbi:MAG: hypothetical protein BMS9Abin07_0423 [Acidimicrobiia bacterium]|nr:MAG: hypothetical protein BMS9Abin07_0423 [Acidimicrobiia bacterium]
MVHRRQIDGEDIVFGNQGALFGNAMTWWDHDTGSVWSQPIGEAILGPRKGERIELLASNMTQWGAWQEEHPQTLALDAPGGFDRFSLDQMALVVDFDTDVVAYSVPLLRDVGVVNDVVAGLEVAVLIDPSDDTRWTVFSRRLDNTVVELSIVDGEVVDVVSGTRFDPIRGIGRGGELDGEILGLLPAFTAFPKDVPTFWPQARFWQP